MKKKIIEVALSLEEAQTKARVALEKEIVC
jgi:hypothetical protein